MPPEAFTLVVLCYNVLLIISIYFFQRHNIQVIIFVSFTFNFLESSIIEFITWGTNIHYSETKTCPIRPKGRARLTIDFKTIKPYICPILR